MAFIIKATGHDESIREQLEQYILQRFLNLTIHQTAGLIINCGDIIDNQELIEVCEKVVASGIDEYSNMKHGTSYLFQIYKGFSRSEYSRSNIFELLLNRLIKDCSKLRVSEICDLLIHMRSIKCEAAEFGNVGVSSP